jgi:DNA-binding winged helix-turn-helix (wHTH) protein
MDKPQEALYPISFRATEARKVGDLLKAHKSITLVGIKRVGISSFLRFFFNHPLISQIYLQNHQHIFAELDANELVEVKIPAFWILTLQHLVEALDTSDVSYEVKKFARKVFSDSIQLQDSYYTFGHILKLIQKLTETNYHVTLVFVRFDRLMTVFSDDFQTQLQQLKISSNGRVSFIFTSFRPLNDLAPTIFTAQKLKHFCEHLYFPPANLKDAEYIFETFITRYQLSLNDHVKELVLHITGGHFQYLQLTLLRLKQADRLPTSKTQLETLLHEDEEILSLSEEIYESLSDVEKNFLNSWLRNHHLAQAPDYLIRTGLIKKDPKTKDTYQLFNPLFHLYLADHLLNQNKTVKATDLTKKEQLLFNLLKDRLDEIVTRDTIIDHVWKDQAHLGVTDWAIDRLIARLRVKLKIQESNYKVITVVSRGYKMRLG